MEEKFLQVNDLKIFTRIAGQGNPFLILHGWGRGLVSWVDIQDELSKYFKVITVDLPGFGKSDMPPKAWNMDNYVQFILEFIKKIEINNFYLLGHSFGGSLAIKLSVQSPDNIKKLILVDSAGRRPKKSFSKKILTSIIPIFKIFSFLPGSKTLRKGFYKLILKSTDYINASGIMKEVFKNVVAEDLSNTWTKIEAPTLILWGEKDKLTPVQDAYLMKKEIKNSELKILNCGHRPHHEKPDLLVKAILDFKD
jgi:pimeloyl-ACP methyl ester carboxylesterase